MAHKHNPVDTDTYFVIDPITKAITTAAKKTILVKGTHNSERFTFQIPRMIEGHDMSISDRIEVHYTNYSADKKQDYKDVYLVDDVTVEEDRVLFSWRIRRPATNLVGTLEFSVDFICFDEEGNIDYDWPTDIFRSIKIIDRMNNTPSDAEEIPDLIKGIMDEVAVTHEWDGTVLEITSASGTSSADLRGPQGEPGSDYILTENDKSEIASDVKSTFTTEEWIFTLEDGSTVTKVVYVG